jgi:DNA (cytosine-5)-methyltransferase 1
LKIGSLFSGVGGLDLGFEKAGHEIIWQCENNAYARAVLKKHWPKVPCYQDIRTLRHAPRVDAIIGGFPCQDISHASHEPKAYLAGEKSGLWKEFARVIELNRPKFVVVENVYQAWRQWLPRVRSDLHRQGYASVPIRVCAADVGAPYERARCFVFAVSYRERKSIVSLNAQAQVVQKFATNRWAHWSAAPPPELVGVAARLPLRMERLDAVGNAVLPRVAQVIGLALGELA